MEVSNKGENSIVFQRHEQGCSSNYFFNFLKTAVTFYVATNSFQRHSICQLVHTTRNLGEQVIFNTLPKGCLEVKCKRHFLHLDQEIEHLCGSHWCFNHFILVREGGMSSEHDQFSFEQHKNSNWGPGALGGFFLLFSRAGAGFVVWHSASWSAHHGA